MSDMHYGFEESDWACVIVGVKFSLPDDITFQQLMDFEQHWQVFGKKQKLHRDVLGAVPGSFDPFEDLEDEPSGWGVDEIFFGRVLAFTSVGYLGSIATENIGKWKREMVCHTEAIHALIGEHLGETDAPEEAEVYALTGGSQTVGQICVGRYLDYGEKDGSIYDFHCIINDNYDTADEGVDGALLEDISVGTGCTAVLDLSDENLKCWKAKVQNIDEPKLFLLARWP